MLILNTHADYNHSLDPVDAEAFGASSASEVERFLTYRDDNRPTPLHALAGLARKFGVASIHAKDESHRLGLGSFKALGGSYAVIRLALQEAARELGAFVDAGDLATPRVRETTGRLTFGCATDGNHGRSVAAGARLIGARSVIFVHSGVSDERVSAIADLGAQIIRVQGNYDDSVAEAERICSQNGWIVVSDTSWPGYEAAPRLVMQGYTALFNEAIRALPDVPTHIFVQAGVGGLAAAAAAFFNEMYGAKRPKFIVVEPDRAACIHASARTGKATKIEPGEPTIMAMLECYEPSMIAWRILSRVADAFMTVREEDAAETMRMLARPAGSDPAIIAGESGAAGLSGLCRAMADDATAGQLGLDRNSRIFVIVTEGATDLTSYTRIVGKNPRDIAALV